MGRTFAESFICNERDRGKRRGNIYYGNVGSADCRLIWREDETETESTGNFLLGVKEKFTQTLVYKHTLCACSNGHQEDTKGFCCLKTVSLDIVLIDV